MIERSGKSAIMHSVVKHQGVLYLAGIVAADKSAPMKGQTEQILTAIGKLLEAAGSDKTQILSTTAYVTNLGLRPEMNEAWIDFFGEHLPSRATIGVADLGTGVLIEVVATASAGK